MSANSIHYQGLWRSAGGDAVPYDQDHPEWLTMLVELLNGQKNASNVSLEFVIDTSSKTFLFRYTDDGDGCTVDEAKKRLLEWAAVESASADSIYGNGTKKFLAKSGPYGMPFKIRSRAKGAKGTDVQVWSSPFMGLSTSQEGMAIEGFPQSGFQIELPVISLSKLGKHAEPDAIQAVVQEIIRSRKTQALLDTILYTVLASNKGETPVEKTSEDWTSFFEYLSKDVRVKKTLQKTVELVPQKVLMEFHAMEVPPHTKARDFHDSIKKLFPIYGDFSGGGAARIHFFNGDTMIEAHELASMYDLKTHATNYHMVQFVFFKTMGGPDDHLFLPQPATTKVQYRYETETWLNVKKLLKEFKAEKKVKKPVVEEEQEEQQGQQEEQQQEQQQENNETHSISSNSSTSNTAGVGVIKMAKHMFTSVFLNERKTQLEAEGAHVTKFDAPTWMQAPEMLVSSTETGWALEIFRERQKGSLEDDILRVYSALSSFVNKQEVSPDEVTMTLRFKLKNRAVQAQRRTEFQEITTGLKIEVYPFKSCLEFAVAE